jgi:hypothetical protein
VSKTHWKKLQNPDYLGAYALEPGQEVIYTMKNIVREMVTGPDGKKEECTVIYFTEAGVKPLICNTTNAKTIEKVYKTPYIEEWAGKKIQIFSDRVKAFGDVVDALRIRPFVPKQAAPVEQKCADCCGKIDAFGNLSAAQLASYTVKKYGRALCSKCAETASKSEEAHTEQRDIEAEGEHDAE